MYLLHPEFAPARELPLLSPGLAYPKAGRHLGPMHVSQRYGPITPVPGWRSRIDPVTLFFFLAYAISWIAALALHLVARQAGLPHFGTLMGMAESTFNARQSVAAYWIRGLG